MEEILTSRYICLLMAFSGSSSAAALRLWILNLLPGSSSNAASALSMALRSLDASTKSVQWSFKVKCSSLEALTARCPGRKISLAESKSVASLCGTLSNSGSISRPGKRFLASSCSRSRM